MAIYFLFRIIYSIRLSIYLSIDSLITISTANNSRARIITVITSISSLPLIYFYGKQYVPPYTTYQLDIVVNFNVAVLHMSLLRSCIKHKSRYAHGFHTFIISPFYGIVNNDLQFSVGHFVLYHIIF